MKRKDFEGKKEPSLFMYDIKKMPPGREKWYGLRKMNP